MTRVCLNCRELFTRTTAPSVHFCCACCELAYERRAALDGCLTPFVWEFDVLYLFDDPIGRRMELAG